MDPVLFWDFDGTLSLPNRSFTSALYDAISQCGYTVNHAEAESFCANLYSWKTPHIDYANRTNAQWWDTHFAKIRTFCISQGIPAEAFDTICTRFRKQLIDVSNYRLYDDTIQTLEACTSLGYQNYLITNNYPEITENIKKLQLSPYFTDYIVSSHIGYEKPRAEFFEYAKKIAGNPTKAYVIGDNPKADILGGHAAGFVTIAVHECRNSEADYYCEQLSQIISIIA